MSMNIIPLSDGPIAKILDVPYFPVILVEGQSGLLLMYKFGNSWYDRGCKVFISDDSELNYINI